MTNDPAAEPRDGDQDAGRDAGATGLLRLASFNLLHGMVLRTGAAGSPDPLRAAAAALGADVIALQEVDAGQPRSGGADQTAEVAAAAGLPYRHFEATVTGTPGERWASVPPTGAAATGPRYGIGLASRYPMTDLQVLPLGRARAKVPLLLPNGKLTLLADEPRTAVAARLDTPIGPVTVACTHLSFVPGWNVGQLLKLTRWLDRLPGPRVLLGDLNMPALLTRAARGWRPLAVVPTYPAPRARIQFDHVLASGDLGAAVTAVTARRLEISDHCALQVTLERPPAAG